METKKKVYLVHICSYAVAHESIREHRGEGRKSRKNYRNKYGFPEWRVK